MISVMIISPTEAGGALTSKVLVITVSAGVKRLPSEAVKVKPVPEAEKIRLLKSDKNLGATDSFMQLIMESTAQYVMLCDQDDVWHPQKLRRSLQRLKLVEEKEPLALVYTDMEVVDKELNPINASFLRHNHLKPDWSKNSYFTLAQSMAAGCSMISSKAAAATRMAPTMKKWL